MLWEHVSIKVCQAFRAHMDMISRGVDSMTVDELRLDIVAPVEGMGEAGRDQVQPRRHMACQKAA